MKINNSVANADTIVNSKNRQQVEAKDGQQQEQQGKVKNGKIKASDLNLFQDPLEEKKKKAMEDAMQFIKNQFKSDGMVDDVLGECRDAIDSSKAMAQEAYEELKDIQKRKDELKEMYPDQEDKEYKARLKELDKEAAEWSKRRKDAHDIIKVASGGIKAIKLETLKHHGMVDAQNAAEKTLEAASGELVGLLKDEAIEKIDEDLDEAVEEAEETKKENEKQEAELQEIRAEREKQAAKIEEELEKQKRAAQNSSVPEQIDVEELLNKFNEVSKNTQQILDEQKLLAEEIKGIVVDSQL